MANIVMMTIGTGGDLFPMIQIGRLLKARGHTVTLFTHCYYSDTVSRAGVNYVALDTPQIFDAMKMDAALLHSPQHTVTFYRRHILPQVLPQYEMVAALCQTKETILLSQHNTHLVSQMIAEKFKIPHLEVFLSPSVLLNNQIVVELHKILEPDVNAYRHTVGLPPITDWENWLHSADKKLAFWPDWYAKPDATWPQGVIPLGFLLDNEAETTPLPSEVERLLNGKDAPILITHATSEPADSSFFAVSIEAARQAGREAILVTGHEAFLPEHLPENVHVFKFLPFASLMPRVSAVIHHGGIGTVATALRAGIPQVVLAAGLDRPDNAERLQGLGVAEHISPSRWTADAVAGAIQRLTESSDVRERCRTMSEVLRTWQPSVELPDLIEQSISAQRVEKKKMLLVQNINYIPTQGGENKCNRLLLEGLAQRGYICRAVVPALGVHGARTRSQFLDALTSRGIQPIESNSEADIFILNNVQIHAVTDAANLRAYAIKQIAEFDPFWALVSAGDPGQVLLEAVLRELPERVVYLAHTTSILPFGPASFFPSEARTNLLRRTAGIITTSQHIRDYIKRWANLDASTIPFPVYGEGPFLQAGRFDQGFVTIINPCSYKGISIFQALAQAMTDVSFAAVPAWGTTEEDRANLEKLSNVRLLPPFDNSDEFFAQTRVLLVPSLWDEAFGISVIEAMLRGIPVIASNAGGLPEAKLGVDFVLPVNPIVQYEDRLDGQMKPVPVIPEQNIAPWVQALTTLLTDPQKYADISAASREAALKFVSQTSVDAFDRYFQQLKLRNPSADSQPVAAQGKDVPSRISTQNLSPKQLALLTKLAKEKAKARSAAQPATISEISADSTLVAVSRSDDTFPVSFNQERLWFLDQFDPGSSAYNMSFNYRIRGLLEPNVLEKSINGLVARHEILRTIFVSRDDRPQQKILPALNISLPVVDLRALSPEAQQSEVLQRARAETVRPFDLATGPMLRGILFQLSAQDHIIVLLVHHIVADGWSIGIFIKELAALYKAYADHQPSPLPTLPIQYADYAVWQRNILQGATLDAQLSYWQEQLKGASGALDLPTDHPRPPVQRHAGAFLRRRLSSSLSVALKGVSRRHGATLFMTLLAAFDVLLYRYSRQTDISVGTIISNRKQLETESLIGFLANTLVLRSDLSGMPSFEMLLQRVREMSLGAYAHQDLPFEKLVEVLQPERNLSRSPLFQVVFTLQNAPAETLELPDLTMSIWECGIYAAQFDLICSIEEDEVGLNVFLGYRTDLFDTGTMERMLDHYQCLLEGIVANTATPIDKLPLLKAVERQQILLEWNATETAYPQGESIHSLFEQQAQKTPAAVAVVYETEQLTYAELNAKSNQLAHYLRSQGVGPDVLVGICIERSVEMIVGLLGILKAGGAYVPIDPNYPKDRIAYMLQDSGVALTLTSEKYVDFIQQNINPVKMLVLPLDSAWSQMAAQPSTNPAVAILPENLAYMIYTSGSTGQPKGALNTHEAIFNRLLWMQSAFPLTPADRILQKTPFSFDVSVWEFFWPLMFGARLVVARPEGHKDPEYLVEIIQREAITTLHFVPSMLHVFLETDNVSACQSLQRVICSGEALSVDLANRFFTLLQAELHNLYGPTEAAVDVSWWACTPDSHQTSIPIGRPIANIQLYVLDSQLEAVPVGVAGELYIGGIGLARGYFNRPALTAEKFIPNPFVEDGGQWTVDGVDGYGLRSTVNSRLYRTGDLARWLPDGSIEYLGRIDHQVKIRGFRIELGEIEATLASLPEVRDVVVLARESTLVAYLVPQAGCTLPATAALRSLLAQTLPEYMIPAYFVQLEQFPLTPNGKLDRKALPAPEMTQSAVSYVAPRTPTEETLAQIFAGVLKRDKVGIHDSFFELGGHSLLATQVISRIRAAFQVKLPLRVLFDTPSVELLAIALDKEVQELEDVEI